MIIEVDCCRPKKCIDDRVVKSSVLAPGDWVGVGLLEEKVRILVVNGVDGDRGSVLIKGDRKKIRVCVYEDGYDQKGRRVNSTELITIRERQIASITTKKCKPNRGVLIYAASL